MGCGHLTDFRAETRTHRGLFESFRKSALAFNRRLHAHGHSHRYVTSISVPIEFWLHTALNGRHRSLNVNAVAMRCCNGESMRRKRLSYLRYGLRIGAEACLEFLRCDPVLVVGRARRVEIGDQLIELVRVLQRQKNVKCNCLICWRGTNWLQLLSLNGPGNTQNNARRRTGAQKWQVFHTIFPGESILGAIVHQRVGDPSNILSLLNPGIRGHFDVDKNVAAKSFQAQQGSTGFNRLHASY